MNSQSPAKVDNDLQQLEERIEELLFAVKSLKLKNTTLQNEQVALIEERNALDKKTKLAKSRVEAMIERLKSMEMDI